MTAAIALPSTTMPRVSRGTRRAIGAAAAAALFLIGAVVAPYLLLGIFVTVAVVLGMAQIGASIDKTFDSLVALDS